MNYWSGKFTITFDPLIDDPSKKRIVYDITPNPAGTTPICLHTAVVDVNDNSLCIDRELSGFQWLYIGERPAGLKCNAVFSDLPSLHTVFDNEAKQKKRNEYQKLWIRKKREKHIKPVMCKQCDQFFLPKRSTAVFCSPKCRLQCHRASKSPAAS